MEKMRKGNRIREHKGENEVKEYVREHKGDNEARE